MKELKGEENIIRPVKKPNPVWEKATEERLEDDDHLAVNDVLIDDISEEWR